MMWATYKSQVAKKGLLVLCESSFSSSRESSTAASGVLHSLDLEFLVARAHHPTLGIPDCFIFQPEVRPQPDTQKS